MLNIFKRKKKVDSNLEMSDYDKYVLETIGRQVSLTSRLTEIVDELADKYLVISEAVKDQQEAINNLQKQFNELQKLINQNEES